MTFDEWTRRNHADLVAVFQKGAQYEIPFLL
jgi:hypothetical protein